MKGLEEKLKEMKARDLAKNVLQHLENTLPNGASVHKKNSIMHVLTWVIGELGNERYREITIGNLKKESKSIYRDLIMAISEAMKRFEYRN